jgi:UDP-GlcNAc:undecaprenyl-phosphate GlcNAc-1-phosphate transferase
MPPLALAAATSFLTIAAAAWCNRAVLGWLPDDPPRPGRKQHARPIPLVGIVLVPAAAPWFVASGEWWLLLAVCTAAATGFVDDRRKEHDSGLDWRAKALGLVVAAAIGSAGIVSPLDAPWTFVATLGLVFVLTNATNFLDNTNGTAAALAAVSLLALDRQGGAGALGFAALGFLPWNWPRARLFLGDAGAYTLGLALGVAAARGVLGDGRALWAVAVQLADFVQVVAARLWLGVPPWVGDRRHLTHIAQNLGVPAIAVAPLFAALAWACTLAMP